MSFRLAISGVAALLAACAQSAEEAAAAASQDERSEVNVESTDLGNGIHMLSTGIAGNLTLLTGPDGAVMVDDQLPNTGAAIEGAVVELAGTGVPRFVVNTHWHGDHTGGNAHFASQGSIIAAHHNIRTRLAASEDEWASEPATLPILTFGEDLTFHMNGQTIEATHVVSAHTDGDAVVFFREADVLHMGDIFFSGLFPYIDLSAGGSVDGFIAGISQGLTMAGDETRIIPGHGPLSTRVELQAALDMVREASFRVRTLVEGGADLEAVRAAEPLADMHDEWNWGFVTTDRMVQTLYNDAVGNDHSWD
jgi:cyclase